MHSAHSVLLLVRSRSCIAFFLLFSTTGFYSRAADPFDTFSEGRKAFSILHQHTPIRYHVNRKKPAAVLEGNWTQPGFNDAGWKSGCYGIGYDKKGDAEDLLQTPITPRKAYSIYTRASFSLNKQAVRELFISADYDDAYAVWINGTPVYRSDELPENSLSWNTEADLHESSNDSEPEFDTVVNISERAVSTLNDGDAANILAAGVWNHKKSSSDLVLLPRLSWKGAHIIKGPYLQNVTKTSIVVCFENSEKTEAAVYYGKSDPNENRIREKQKKRFHEMRITGLSPNTAYKYFIVSGPVTSTIARFKTAPPPSEPFRFIAYGDSRSGPARHRRVIEGPPQAGRQEKKTGIAGAGAAFILHAGDFVYHGRNYFEWEEAFFGPFFKAGTTAPLYPVPGNHEYYRKNPSDSHFWYFDFFNVPGSAGTEAYYAFTYGCARFIALNTNMEYDHGSPQHTWLAEELASRETEAASWVVVFFHDPPFSSGEHGGEDDVQEDLVPLFEKHTVDFVLNGHDHIYERSLKNGIHYVVTGGGGAPFCEINEEDNPYQQYAVKALHFCVFDVSPEKITFQAWKPCHTVFDEVILSKKSTQKTP